MALETEIKLLRAALYLFLIAMIAIVVFLLATMFVSSANFLSVCFAWCFGIVAVCGLSSMCFLPWLRSAT